ncbi:uncharacterized protein TNCV_3540241 [Trichonephila clavipes]|nr:uncharacterized protein TNCV_3540241 [Trichonephila clavipes]
MACEIKLLESEATTGFFVLLGEQGKKAILDWVMKEGLILPRYECPKCKMDMRLVERKGTVDGFEWRCRVQSKENPHFVCRSECKIKVLKTAPKLARWIKDYVTALSAMKYSYQQITNCVQICYLTLKKKGNLLNLKGKNIKMKVKPKTRPLNLVLRLFESRQLSRKGVATVAEWYRYRIVACLVTSSSLVPLKTRRVGQRCSLNLSRVEMSSRWCGVVVRKGGASSGVVHVT